MLTLHAGVACILLLNGIPLYILHLCILYNALIRILCYSCVCLSNVLLVTFDYGSVVASCAMYNMPWAYDVLPSVGSLRACSETISTLFTSIDEVIFVSVSFNFLFMFY